MSTLRNALAVSALLLAGMAQAQTGTIRLLVGFPAGGGTDVIARTLAEKLKDSLSTTAVVENRAGAGGQIAAQALKSAPADGTTFSSRMTTRCPSCRWSAVMTGITRCCCAGFTTLIHNARFRF